MLTFSFHYIVPQDKCLKLENNNVASKKTQMQQQFQKEENKTKSATKTAEAYLNTKLTTSLCCLVDSLWYRCCVNHPLLKPLDTDKPQTFLQQDAGLQSVHPLHSGFFLL